MKIVISSGHGKKVPGAIGPKPWGLDEHAEAVRVVNRTAEYFRAAGVECITYEDTVSTSQNENLDRIVDFHNSKTRDLDVSVHFNAYETTSKPMGVECLYVNDLQRDLSDTVAKKIAAATGLPNRGPKKRTDLAFLNGTDEPAILVETLFVDSHADADAYHAKFDAICNALAEAISGQAIKPEPSPPKPVPPSPPDQSKPTLRKGDEGPYVSELQKSLNDELAGCHLVVDGDFGGATDTAVRDYQRSRALDVDGICGQDTWNALDTHAPFVPPLPSLLSVKDQEAIRNIASESRIQQYNWQDRGIMPPGYCQGMALAFAVTYLQLIDDVSWAIEMAKANTHNSDKDVLSWYAGKFDDLGMSNDRPGPDTLRHLFALMLGLGMRESSGRYCCGRDTSAGSSSQSSDTCEAGTFQQSWNSSSSTDEMQNLMDAYSSDTSNCYVDTWKQGVSCSSSEWACVGSGNGYKFQDMCKNCPTYCAQSCAVGLRNIRQHWGPINRYEAELRADADKMFKDVQNYLDTQEPAVA
jgi:hypothetical protein